MPLGVVFKFLKDIEVHTSATGSAASTQVEGCSHPEKSNSERVADCGVTPCSAWSSFGCAVRFGVSLRNLWIIEATAETVSNVYNPIQNLGMVEQLVSAGNDNQMHIVLVGMTKVDLESRIMPSPNQLAVI
ncbi:MAG: hypothetical protein EOP09_04655 [Proteobacteria bacterium]|nr:MAG: hypothetical protein EOP09_04655 [Pseudomonadota bacterium]